MKYGLCLLATLSVFASCTKPGDDNSETSDATVYVSGYSFDKNYATLSNYWEDSVRYDITNGDHSTYTSAIFSSGNQVFVAGLADRNIPTPGLWIDGTSKDLSTTDKSAISNITGIYVSGNDIYMVGDGPDAQGSYQNGSQAKLWKNGITIPVYTGARQSQAVGVTVNGTDVYVSWSMVNSSGYLNSMYNKNDQTFILGDTNSNSEPGCICYSGSDIYIAGNISDTTYNSWEGGYWKNGIFERLIGLTGESYATGICVSGKDVYVSGNLHVPGATGVNYAMYWKNGVEHILSDGSLYGTTTGIAVLGTDVYVSGIEGNVPKYWKNDVPHKLSYDTSHFGQHTTGIFVVKK